MELCRITFSSDSNRGQKVTSESLLGKTILVFKRFENVLYKAKLLEIREQNENKLMVFDSRVFNENNKITDYQMLCLEINNSIKIYLNEELK